MTIFDKIYELSKKLSEAILKNRDFRDLEDSEYFSDDAKVHIIQYLSDEDIKENLELLNKIDKESGWQKIEDRISLKGKAKPQKRPSIPSFYKVAAVIVLLISFSYLTLNGRSNNGPLEVEQVNISSGTDRAILTNQNGLDLVLEKNKSYENEVAHSDGARLTYSNTYSDTKTDFNQLTIPRGGQYQIELSDGTLVWLNSDSKLKYPVAFKSGKTRTVELLYGEAYFDVSPSSNHNDNTFKVLTKGQEVEVLGTEFNIKAYNNERYIYTTLVEGKINVGTNGKLKRLKPSEQIVMEIDTKQMRKSTVNIDYHIAWIQGYFNFKDTSLKEIMVVLSRWFDVDIVFESQTLKDVKFSGLLSKKQNIEEILNGIQNTKFIKAYEIKNKTITIQ